MRLTREFRDKNLQLKMRTHGRKNGFVTKGQEARLAKWLPKIGLIEESRIAESGLNADQPIVMEIGFGNGDFMVHLAETHPDWQLVGVEIYLPGVAKCVSRLEQAGFIERCRISQLPAQYVLEALTDENMLDGIFVNHPDPWPKVRHHKRRIIQKDMALLMVSRLKPGGFIKLATDKPDLGEWMQEILDATPGLTNVAGKGGFIERDDDRPHTRFEKRGLNEGRTSQFLHYTKD